MNEKYTILVVDNDMSERTLVSTIFRQTDYSVQFASNGKETIQMCMDLKPDILLLDVMLPDKNGFEICREIRKNPYLSSMPIIMVAYLDDRKSRLEALEAGADEFLSKPLDLFEVKARVTTILKLNRFRRLLYDKTTGLPNENFLLDYIQNVLIKRSIANNKFAIVAIKIKNANFFSNYLLQTDATDFSNNFTKILYIENYVPLVVSYNGSGYFFVVIDQVEQNNIEKYLSLLLKKLELPTKYLNGNILLSCSIGCVLYPNDGIKGDELLYNAKLACSSIQNEFSKARLYDENMRKTYEQNIELTIELYNAIKNNEFLLHFQPQIKSKTREIVGVEALVRWDSLKYGFKFPDFFISQAEESGAIIYIGSLVIKNSLRFISKFSQPGNSFPEISINVSPLQFSTPRLEDKFQTFIDYHHISPERVKIEITESLIISNPKETQKRMLNLKNKGFKISIDDFGTGHSSLAYIKTYPADELKIDRAFIKNIHNSSIDCEIVKYIIELAKSLKLTVVAEGVENEVQAQILENLGCDFLQGYHFSKPVTDQEITNLILTQPFKVKVFK